MPSMLWVQSQQFWPTTAAGWVTLAGAVVTYTIAIVVWLWKVGVNPVVARIAAEENTRKEKMDELANRIADVAREQQTDKGKRFELELFMERSTEERRDMWKALGEQQGEVRQLTEMIHGMEKERIRELSKLNEGQAAIRERLDVVGGLRDVGQEIIRELRTGERRPGKGP